MVLGNYKDGWDKELGRYPNMRLLYVPVDIAWKAAYYVGMSCHYPHFYAKSGYPTFFLYNLDNPWVFDLFRFAVVDSALDSCNVHRYEGEPGSIEEAVKFIQEMITHGRLVWMSWYDPILVYGIEINEGSIRLHWYHPYFAPDGITWGPDELQKWWEWSDVKGAHKLIAPADIKSDDSVTEIEIAEKLCELLLKNFRQKELNLDGLKAKMGLAAYDQYIADLKNKDINFLEKINDEQPRLLWFDIPIYAQWTQNFALHAYLSFVSKSIPGEKGKLMLEAAELFGKAYANWLKWEKIVGREKGDKVLMKNVAKMDVRIKAAEEVTKARDNVAKALEVIDKMLKIGKPKARKKRKTNPK